MSTLPQPTPSLIEQLDRCAAESPDQAAITGHTTLSWLALQHATHLASQSLPADASVIAFMMDNGSDWLVTDLACLVAQRIALPLPAFFTDTQIQHALARTGCRHVITDQPGRFPHGLQRAWPSHTGQQALQLVTLPATPAVTLPAGTAKITFTSGSTGDPKGVCLAQPALERTAHALNERMAECATGTHLCALPLAVLLENIAGAYRGWFAGSSISLWPLATLGMRGASGFDAAPFHDTLVRSAAATVIVLPQMLSALVALQRPAPPSLRFMAVGGAPLPAHTLLSARALGYPVFEGYGLSECGSVVSLNAPGHDRPGSIGKPLSHVRVRIEDDEISVSGNPCLGYAGEAVHTDPVATGDIGRLDDEGFLYIEGRKTNRIVTALGRNISPEWVESTLQGQPGIRQCFVTGHGQAYLGALLVSADAHSATQAIEQANAQLPDYAQVKRWQCIDEGFSVTNQCLTANGRLRRPQIEQHYATTIATLFTSR